MNLIKIESIGMETNEVNERPFDFRPISNYVVIAIHTQEGLIKIPDETKKLNKPIAYTQVIAISEDLDKDNQPMVKSVKVGDKVLLSQGFKHDAEVFNFRGDSYLVIRENYILGVLPPDYIPETNYKPVIAKMN